MKYISVLLFAIVLTIGLSMAATGAGIFAKQLPTSASLNDRLIGTWNGFKGSVELSHGKVKPGQEQLYESCLADNSNGITKVNELWKDLVIIYMYYDAVEGSEEALDNFNKWEADFKSTYPDVIQKVDKCFAEAQPTETQQ